MYKFIQSESLDLLAGKLADVIGNNLPDDPLSTVEVIVPNRDTANWLTHRLAETLGIAANLDYQLPSEWFWSRVRDLKPGLPGLLPSDIRPMSWSVLSILRDRDKLEQLPELKVYLDKHSESGELYAYKLALTISSVFDEYQVYRPRMLKQWEEGTYPAGSNRWQGVLWNLLVDRWQSEPEPEPHRAELFFEVLTGTTGKAMSGSDFLYIFNPEPMPNPIHSFIRQLSQSLDVCHFHKSCISGLFDKQHQKFENEILQEFGEQQVEIHSIQKTIAVQDRKSYDFIELESESSDKPDTVLQVIKRSVYDNKPLPELLKKDFSVEVHCCHSPLREVETLKTYLTGIFSDDTGISPDDVLVVTPDLESYSPYIEAVFGTGEEGMPSFPYHLPTGYSSEQTDIPRVFGQLLQLLSSRFYKNDIIDFLKNRPISKRFELTEAAFRKLSGWLDENRVIWGMDGSHREEYNQNNDSRQTWQVAFERGWLGQLMAVEPGEMLDERLLFSGVDSSDDKELWSELYYFINLLDQARTECKSDKTAEEWKMILLKWVGDFLPAGMDYESDIEQLYKLINQTADEIDTGGYRDAISFGLIRHNLTEKLKKSSSVTGSYCNGIQFQSMVPARSIPFEVVALIGLSDDRFPRQSNRPEFDIMGSDPLPGERDRKKEDRNLFLESILSAGERHYTSFIGKSIKDNETLPPSPILYKWISLLERITSEKTGEFTVDHKLNGFSSSYFTYRDSGSYSSVYLNTAKILRQADKTDGWISDHPLPDHEAFVSGILSLKGIENFFSNPAKSFFSERLNIRLPDYRKDEEAEFSLDGLSRYILFQHLFGWAVRNYDIDTIEQLLIQSGQLPAGWPGRRKLAEMLESVHLALDEIRERGFEPGLERSYVDILLNRFRLTGTVQSFSANTFLDLHPSKESGKRMLKSWIRHLTFCLNAEGNQHTTTVFTGFRSGKNRWIRFRFTEDAAEQYMNLIDCYRAGMSTPVNLYIDSGYAYQRSIEKGGDEKKALTAALKTWDNEFSTFTESRDPYIQLLMGSEPEADTDALIRCAELIYKPMIDHLEEI